MATPGQLDEKARLRAAESSITDAATPAQLAEKAKRANAPFDGIATPAQLAEKSRNDIPSSSTPSSFATSAQLAEKAQNHRAPPPLPPRTNSQPLPPPPYNSNDAERGEMISEQWHSHDPRSSSTHSLVPSESNRDGRRTLLLVFIHGFMGNETSFQSFPAHIHNLLSITLAESHVVHTKIYPRYKSRKAINFARDDFSIWLEPHEGSHVDVVLLGHSMGGILGAEVALQRPFPPTHETPFRHRILGTINFDTPFLGMHPGVIASGLGSLFRPAPETPGARSPQSIPNSANTLSLDNQTSVSSTSYATSIAGSEALSQLSIIQSITSPSEPSSPRDPFFNPPFPNDIRLPERKGWSSLLHFVNKHSDGLADATKQYFMSHVEFGGCMADYPGLKNRYENIRALEDIDDTRRNVQSTKIPNRRIRFVNYYTASTGIPKPPKQPKPPPGEVIAGSENMEALKPTTSLRKGPLNSHPVKQGADTIVQDAENGAMTPRTLDEAGDTSSVKSQMNVLGKDSDEQDEDIYDDAPEMQHVDSMPIPDDEEIVEPANTLTTSNSEVSADPIQKVSTGPPLPPIPDAPSEPEPINLDLYTDKDSRKIAEKEQKRTIKVYQQAVKDRESAINDRRKLIEKREKKARQEQERQAKADEKQRLKEEKEEAKKKTTIKTGKQPEKQKERTGSVASLVKDDKPKRDKKFCMLPSNYGGEVDKCWIRIYMEGVDEVGAHCGLFFPGPQYEGMVGNVGDRIGKWVQEDATRRAILDAENVDRFMISKGSV